MNKTSAISYEEAGVSWHELLASGLLNDVTEEMIAKEVRAQAKVFGKAEPDQGDLFSAPSTPARAA